MSNLTLVDSYHPYLESIRAKKAMGQDGVVDAATSSAVYHDHVLESYACIYRHIIHGSAAEMHEQGPFAVCVEEADRTYSLLLLML